MDGPEESFEGRGWGGMSPVADDSRSNQDSTSALVSPRVSSMANRLYEELEKLLPSCGEEALGSITPLLVDVLQSLDGALADLSDSQQALEEAIDDNEQLHAQYEKEKKLRREEQHARMRNEDQGEDERRELAKLVEQLRQHNRKLTSQLKMSRGRAESGEEKLERLRQENTDLTHKYRRVNHALQQYLQRGRHTPSQKLTSGGRGEESPVTIKDQDPPTTFVNQSLPVHIASKAQSEDEMSASPSESVLPNPVRSPTPTNDRPVREELLSIESASLTRTFQPVAASSPVVGRHVIQATTQTAVVTQATELVHDAETLSTVPEDDGREETKAVWRRESSEFGGDEDYLTLGLESGETSMADELHNIASRDAKKSEEVAVESLSYDIISAEAESNGVIANGIEQVTLERLTTNNESLSRELAVSGDDETLREMDPGADISLIDLQTDKLMEQVHDLETKLNSMRAASSDDANKVKLLEEERQELQQRVEDLEGQQSEAHKKCRQLEEELREKMQDLEEAKNLAKENEEPLFPGVDDNWSVQSNLKRYTRVEMARVLRERNEFKEKYHAAHEELNELRARLAEEEKKPKKKEKVSLWKLFAQLFSRKNPAAPSNVVTKKPDNLRMNPISKEITFDEGRFEAFGWSLPTSMKPPSSRISSVGQPFPDGVVTSQAPKLRSVPMLIDCSPLTSEDQGLLFSPTQVWCAAAVSNTPYSNPSLHSSDTVTPSSMIWLCSGTSEVSNVTIIDGSSPRTIIDHFPICPSPILSIASVGGKNNDALHFAGPFPKFKRHQSLTASPRHSPALPSSSSSSPIHGQSAVSLEHGSRQLSPQHATSSLYQSTLSPGVDPDVLSVHSDYFASRPSSQTSSPPLSPVERGADASSTVSSEELARPRLRLPTMWIGAEFGCLYIHSVLTSWKKCLYAKKVDSSILSIVHAHDKVFLSMSNGHVLIFRRHADEAWDLDNMERVVLSSTKDPVSVMMSCGEHLWCGVGRSISVLNGTSHEVIETFQVHPSARSTVQRLAQLGDGVWVSVRMDSTIRLYHAKTFQPLQEVDVSESLQSVLTLPGSKRKPQSLVRISSLIITNGCLWIGGSNGTVVSFPLSKVKPSSPEPPPTIGEAWEVVPKEMAVETMAEQVGLADSSGDGDKEDENTLLPPEETFDATSNIPYCDVSTARLSFHGHELNVCTLVSCPGVSSREGKPEMLSPVSFVLSSGSGYVDFRLDSEKSGGSPVRNHVIVWQVACSN